MTTETTTPATSPESELTPQPEQQPTTSPQEAAEETTEQAEPNREAAKYRRQLRDVEAERDQVTAQLQAARSHLLDRLAADPFAADSSPHDWRILKNPSDLWVLGGLDRDTAINDDGSPNLDAINTALTNLHKARPELFRLSHSPKGAIGPIVPSEGDIPDMSRQRGSWAGVLSPYNGD